MVPYLFTTGDKCVNPPVPTAPDGLVHRRRQTLWHKAPSNFRPCKIAEQTRSCLPSITNNRTSQHTESRLAFRNANNYNSALDWLQGGPCQKSAAQSTRASIGQAAALFFSTSSLLFINNRRCGAVIRDSYRFRVTAVGWVKLGRDFRGPGPN